jgi:hypothetical protein
MAFGLFRLLNPRHPRALARIPPTQLGLWSFAVAIAHGAGFMLVPIYLGLCRSTDSDSGHEAAGALISGNLAMAMLVSVVHGAAMIATGGILAWLVYRYLGLQFVSRSWFNLDVTWAVAPSWWGRFHSPSAFRARYNAQLARMVRVALRATGTLERKMDHRG